MNNKYCRPVSPLEKIYLSKTFQGQHFTNQGIIEGTGSFDVDTWEKAVEVASMAHAGSRVVLQRKGLKYFWVEGGNMPKVRLIRDCKWDGASSNNIPYLPDHLCPFNGPVCEIVLLECQDTKLMVVVNTLHAVMDGIGTLTWGVDVFRATRGEKPLGSTTAITDVDIANRFKVSLKNNLRSKCVLPFSKKRTDEQGGIWVRRIIPHTISRIIPKISRIVAAETLNHKEGNFRLIIPVDLRRRMNGVYSTGNLTGNIFLDISKTDSEKELYLRFLKQLRNHDDSYLPFIMKLIRYLPPTMIHQALLNNEEENDGKEQCDYSGVVTHLGKLTQAEVSGGGFIGKSWCALNSMTGPGLPPLFIGISDFITNGKDHCSLVIGARHAYATYDDLHSLSDKIISTLLYGS